MKSWKISLGPALHMDVLSGLVREEVIGRIRIKNVSDGTLLLTLLLLLREHDSLELRNCVSVSHHLVAVKGEIPTQQVTPSAYKRQPTKHAVKGEIPTQ